MTKPIDGACRILIVEDEVIIAMEIQVRLENAGFLVCGIVATGEKAILAAREKKPDLILMDITLRGPMDGVEAATRIVAEKRIPVIFLSASDNEAIMRQAKNFPADGFISKPFVEADLIFAIRRALGA